MHKLFIFIFLSLCLGACSLGHNDYSDFSNKPAQGWGYNDTISFTTSFADSIATGNLSIAVRHDNSYPFRNLWVEVTINEDSIVTSRDSINIEFADIYGNWHGKGIGSTLQIEKGISEGITLPDSANIHIRHIMRVDTLQGIEQLGIFFFSDKQQD